MFKKVLFSLSAVGLVSLGSLGLASAQLTNTPDTQYNPGVGTEQLKQDGLLKAVKTFVNRVLGILSLIALVILLRGGFQMVTAAGDDGKYKKGFTILKQAAIGLAVVGFAWLFVSLIFWLINRTATPSA